MTAFTSGRDEPGRNLRNLGEPWKPLRRGPASEPLRTWFGEGGRWGGRARTGWGGRTCTDPGRVVYVPPPAPRSKGGELLRRSPERARPELRETARGMSRKSRGVYAVITDFSLQYQRSQRTGTELGKPWTVSAPIPALLARRGRAHTNWLDRRPGPIGACPRPSKLGRGCARASSLKAHATVPPDLYGAWRVAALRDAGAWEIRTQRWHTPALGALASRTCRPCLGTCMPGCTDLRLGAPVGAAMAYTRHAGEGCAGRFAAGRGVDRPDGLSNRPGLRVPATPSGRG